MQRQPRQDLVLTVAGRGHSPLALGWPATAVAQAPTAAGGRPFPASARQDRRPRRASDDESARAARPSTICAPIPRPFRSEVMIEALEGAIQRYQRIVANGGWPAIPGSRMIRPEDDDERMPLLRQRLMISGELARRQSDGVRLRLQRGPRGRRAPLPGQPRAARHRPRRQADAAGAERPAAGAPGAAARQPAAAARSDGAADRGPLHPGQRRRPSSSRRWSGTRSSCAIA